jgi:alpha-beta hydrolase superfamily lysophospholipase
MINPTARFSTYCLCLLLYAVVVPAQAQAQPSQDTNLTFTMEDGFRLPAREWRPPAGVRYLGVILALHGFADSRDAWQLPAPVLAQGGYVVVAYDQRGFGGTIDRGQWVGTQTMVADAATIANQLRHRYPESKLTIMGESMGGAIALLLAADHPNAADDYILLAPAVWDRASMPLALRISLSLANAVAPNLRLRDSQAPTTIIASDNFAALVELSRDPLTLHSTSVAALTGLVALMDAAMQAGGRVQGTNLLVLDGRQDQLVPASATATLWSKLPATARRGYYLNGFHLLLRDRDRALVEADILAWLQAPGSWLPSGSDINAASFTATSFEKTH